MHGYHFGFRHVAGKVYQNEKPVRYKEIILGHRVSLQREGWEIAQDKVFSNWFCLPIRDQYGFDILDHLHFR